MSTRRASIVGTVLCILLAVATSASAECAWVMWIENKTTSFESDKETIEWSAAGVPTAADCYSSIKATIKMHNKPNSKDEEIKVIGNNVIIRESKHHSMVQTYTCLPDTVDPRGPKGGK